MKYRSDFIVVQNFLCISDTRPEDTPARKYSNKLFITHLFVFLRYLIIILYAYEEILTHYIKLAGMRVGNG